MFRKMKIHNDSNPIDYIMRLLEYYVFFQPRLEAGLESSTVHRLSQ